MNYPQVLNINDEKAKALPIEVAKLDNIVWSKSRKVNRITIVMDYGVEMYECISDIHAAHAFSSCVYTNAKNKGLLD